ncbi:processing peptidase [Thalassoporum mexicanum PCC 7367]|uniref:M16 family metallopeptidase n=1 Tax=Thalassoporum mexicanum TaxID=3457544 RepID=UPI00029FC261|nr:pitrilysin family protein [Pseudanabaena sp. PCC 7367]AFY71492.1 processing peptidase [Pseudanabaena sp. PCC 7367]
MKSIVRRAGILALAVLIAGGMPFSLATPRNGAIAIQIQELRAQAQTPQPAMLTDGVRRTVLENGLTVLTKEVPTVPAVSVHIWYRVGSRNERPGITGISHQLEHLLFKGTKDRPIQFGRLFSALGSSSNAFTSYDMTAYFGTVSSNTNKVEALLTLEADRMVNTVAGAEELNSERTVVLSELDGYDNSPGNRLFKAIMAKAFANTSYAWPVIGDRADVEGYTAEQIQNYYRTYYRPDNATLIVVGNFETDELLPKIKETFGTITAPPRPRTAKLPEKQSGTINQVSNNRATKTTNANVADGVEDQPVIYADKVVLEEPGSIPLLRSVYPTLPPITHPDTAAIDLLASILSSGRSSRLYQALVQTGIASGARASAATMIDPGWFSFTGAPTDGNTLEDIDRLILAEVKKIQTEPIDPAALERAQTQVRSSFILSNRDISSQAIQLGYNQTVAKDYRFSDRYLADVEKVTVADIQRVANKYLDPQKRVLGLFKPTVITAQVGNPLAADGTIQENRTPSEPVDPAEVAKYLPEDVLKIKAAELNPVLPERVILPNSLTLLLLPDDSTPSVTIAGQILAGTGFDSIEKAGLGALTAQNLRNGTNTKDALALAAELENIGASLGFSAGREQVSIGASMLAEDLPTVVDQLADILQNASFPADELELNRQRNLIGLKAELDSPGSLARRVFQSELYPAGHPYHAMRTEESIKAIAREDLVEFYETYYRPDTTTLVLMGDFEVEEVKQLISDKLGNWQAKGEPPALKYPTVEDPSEISKQEINLAGKTQAVTVMGHPAIDRYDPRYYTALVLNQVLGGDTLSSRLGTEIRDRQGLTYGIYSYFQTGKGKGAFVVQMQTSGKDVDAAVASTLAIMRDVHQNGITQKELDAAKASLINSFPVSLANPDSIAGAILRDQVYGFAIGDFYDFPQKIESITLSDVNQVAEEVLLPDQLVVVTVAPKEN